MAKTKIEKLNSKLQKAEQKGQSIKALKIREKIFNEEALMKNHQTFGRDMANLKQEKRDEKAHEKYVLEKYSNYKKNLEDKVRLEKEQGTYTPSVKLTDSIPMARVKAFNDIKSDIKSGNYQIPAGMTKREFLSQSANSIEKDIQDQRTEAIQDEDMKGLLENEIANKNHTNVLSDLVKSSIVAAYPLAMLASASLAASGSAIPSSAEANITAGISVLGGIVTMGLLAFKNAHFRHLNDLKAVADKEEDTLPTDSSFIKEVEPETEPIPEE